MSLHLPLCSWGLLCCSRHRGLAGWVCLWHMCSNFLQVDFNILTLKYGINLLTYPSFQWFSHLHCKSGVLPVIWERVRNHLSHLILFFFRGNTITVNVVDRSRNWTLMMGCGDWCVHYSKIERCGACTKGWFDLGGPAWRKLTGGELPGHIRGVKSK